MSKPKRCSATTKNGTRCKNTISKGGLCAVHTVDKAVKKKLPSKFEKVDKGVKFAGSVIGGVAGLIKIVEFVATHWSHVEGALHFVSLAGWNYDQKRLTTELNNKSIYPNDVTAIFQRWFFGLPEQVQRELETEFGDVFAIARSAKEEVIDARNKRDKMSKR